MTRKKQIEEIMKFIKDFQPGIGWKFVFEVEFFSGELAYEFGFKEREDHTGYRYWKIEVGMTLFALKLQLQLFVEAQEIEKLSGIARRNKVEAWQAVLAGAPTPKPRRLARPRRRRLGRR